MWHNLSPRFLCSDLIYLKVRKWLSVVRVHGTSECCCPSVRPPLPLPGSSRYILFSKQPDIRSSSKSTVIVFKQQQQYPPHNVHTWSSLFSSIDAGAEALNDDLQRLSKFLLHDINRANFTSRLRNNKSPSIHLFRQQQQRNGLAANYSSIIRFRLHVALSWILVNYYSPTTTDGTPKGAQPGTYCYNWIDGVWWCETAQKCFTQFRNVSEEDGGLMKYCTPIIVIVPRRECTCGRERSV